MDIQTSDTTTIRSFMLRHVTAIDVLAGAIIIILVMVNVYVGMLYRDTNHELSKVKDQQVSAQINQGVLGFTGLFIDKVLKAQGEIDFDTRLKLESAVRGLNDDRILSAWLTFTNSATEQEAQNAVKNLLGILVNKIQI